MRGGLAKEAPDIASLIRATLAGSRNRKDFESEGLPRLALEGGAQQAELALDRIVLHTLGNRAMHRGIEPAHAVEQRERAVDQIAQALGQKLHRVVAGAV